mmetsp:Transcript_11526/g.13963  ORF Transcript_11526/g.13963 Transcript_11526/m.13963 type:complete len:428 (-) Transcript_11526:132-1415(-)
MENMETQTQPFSAPGLRHDLPPSAFANFPSTLATDTHNWSGRMSRDGSSASRRSARSASSSASKRTRPTRSNRQNQWSETEEIILVGNVMNQWYKRGSLTMQRSSKNRDAENGTPGDSEKIWEDIQNSFNKDIKKYSIASKPRNSTALRRHFKVMKTRFAQDTRGFKMLHFMYECNFNDSDDSFAKMYEKQLTEKGYAVKQEGSLKRQMIHHDSYSARNKTVSGASGSQLVREFRSLAQFHHANKGVHNQPIKEEDKSEPGRGTVFGLFNIQQVSEQPESRDSREDSLAFEIQETKAPGFYSKHDYNFQQSTEYNRRDDFSFHSSYSHTVHGTDGAHMHDQLVHELNGCKHGNDPFAFRKHSDAENSTFMNSLNNVNADTHEADGITEALQNSHLEYHHGQEVTNAGRSHRPGFLKSFWKKTHSRRG